MKFTIIRGEGGGSTHPAPPARQVHNNKSERGVTCCGSKWYSEEFSGLERNWWFGTGFQRLQFDNRLASVKILFLECGRHTYTANGQDGRGSRQPRNHFRWCEKISYVCIRFCRWTMPKDPLLCAWPKRKLTEWSNKCAYDTWGWGGLGAEETRENRHTCCGNMCDILIHDGYYVLSEPCRFSCFTMFECVLFLSWIGVWRYFAHTPTTEFGFYMSYALLFPWGYLQKISLTFYMSNAGKDIPGAKQWVRSFQAALYSSLKPAALKICNNKFLGYPIWLQNASHLSMLGNFADYWQVTALYYYSTTPATNFLGPSMCDWPQM